MPSDAASLGPTLLTQASRIPPSSSMQALEHEPGAGPKRSRGSVAFSTKGLSSESSGPGAAGLPKAASWQGRSQNPQNEQQGRNDYLRIRAWKEPNPTHDRRRSLWLPVNAALQNATQSSAMQVGSVQLRCRASAMRQAAASAAPAEIGNASRRRGPPSPPV